MELAEVKPTTLVKSDELDKLSHIYRKHELPSEPDPDVYEKLKNPWSLDQVERLLINFCFKRVGDEDKLFLDPDVVLEIDVNIDYKIYIVGNNVYNRQTLYETYPFAKLGVQPEMYCSKIFLEEEEILQFNKLEVGIKIVKRPNITDKSIATKIFVANHKWPNIEIMKGATEIMMDKSDAAKLMLTN